MIELMEITDRSFNTGVIDTFTDLKENKHNEKSWT